MDDRVRWFIIAASVIILLYVIFLFVRRYLKSRLTFDETEGDGLPFSLSNLEAMRKQGLISDEEFKKLRRAALMGFTDLPKEDRRKEEKSGPS